MPLIEYLLILLRRWYVVLLPSLVIGVFTIVTSFPQVIPSNRYQVVIRYGIGLPPEGASSGYSYDRQYVWTASEYANQALADALVTGKFADAVVKRATVLGNAITRDKYLGSVTRDYRGSILTVSVIGSTPEEAIAIAQGVSGELTENSGQYFQQLSKTSISPVQALDTPDPILVPPTTRTSLDLPMRLAFGLITGAGIAILMHFFDPLLRDRRDVNRMRVPILGEIPKG